MAETMLERRLAYLVKRLAGGSATEHDIAEMAVINHRLSKTDARYGRDPIGVGYRPVKG